MQRWWPHTHTLFIFVRASEDNTISPIPAVLQLTEAPPLSALTAVDLSLIYLTTTSEDTLGEEIGRRLCPVVVSLCFISVYTSISLLASGPDNSSLYGSFKADGSMSSYIVCRVLLYHLGCAIDSTVYVDIRALALDVYCPSAEKGKLWGNVSSTCLWEAKC